MRLFVAIDLDASARSSIEAAQSRLRALIGPDSRLRWVRPEQMHLTLVFVGEVDDQQASRVATAIAEPIAQPAFELRFGGLGAFPPRGAPRALWIGAEQGEPELRLLQKALADSVARSGVALEQREFSPHLTLARWKASRPSDRRRALSGSNAVSAPIPVRVDHATLYHSRLTSGGSIYTPLAHARLALR
jgi:2'-5' RNA ligase